MTTAVQANRSAVSKACLAWLISVPMPGRGRQRTSAATPDFQASPMAVVTAESR